MIGQEPNRPNFPYSGGVYAGLMGFFCLLFSASVLAQSLPVSFPLLTDNLRREQLMGRFPLSYSFQHFPLTVTDIVGEYSPSDSLAFLPFGKPLGAEGKKVQVRLVPLQLSQNYNASHPYGWGDGPLLPARGFQHLVEFGIHTRIGPVHLQLYPQIHTAQNLPFEEYNPELPELYFKRIANFIGRLDIPVRPGSDRIRRILPGNSHVKVHFGAFAAGISTENLWWGPGKQQALLISDNAEGFLHGTIHSRNPVKTGIGHFEGQYFLGKLENSNLPYYSDGSFDRYREYPDDWRYVTGVSVSYSPVWIKGLSLGLGRTFTMYRRKLEEDGWRAWFPIFEGLQKEQVGLDASRARETDQHFTIFSRWVVPAARMEVYGEFIRTDHALNWRELLLNPEHSRGYTLGFSKLVPLTKGDQIYIQLEMTQTENSVNNLVKYEGGNLNLNHGGLGLYENFQVVHGLTQRGQVLGSGLGHSGNSARITLSKVRGLNQYGLSLERLTRDANFFNYNYANGVEVLRWVDLSLGAHWEQQYDRVLVAANARLIRSHNYNYAVKQSNSLGRTGYKKTNFHSRLKLAYLF
ncbi:capsule assembly Wzi family protein [Cyclobacterium xiamenense]|uniref:capsule assembly Wzi family protein n=1 Tax=Cyclobacterium xiamenense TaxID=1297121 RepID=UPI0012B7797B|nr:capsule assembly Wzi family protein [Cyclobacterium xiamenense]